MYTSPLPEGGGAGRRFFRSSYVTGLVDYIKPTLNGLHLHDMSENKPPFANEWVRTTPVKGSDIVGLPTRLFDSETGTIVDSKSLAFVEGYDILSYVWGQWTDINLGPISGGLSVKLKRQMTQMKGKGVQRYIWIDNDYIIQTQDEEGRQDRARELPKMHHYYTRATRTHVLLPDVDCTIPTKGKMSFAEAGRKACELRVQVEKSEWLSRLWTFQEGACAGEVRLWMESQDMSGDDFTMRVHVAKEFLSCSGESNSVQRKTHRKRMKEYELILPMDYTDEKLQFRERARKYYGKEVRLGRGQRRPGMYACITEAWVAAGNRKCKEPEDLVNGILAMLENGDKVVPAVGMGFGEAMRRVAQAGLVSTTILCSATSMTDNLSWIPALQQTAKGKWQLESTQVFDYHSFGLHQRGMRDIIKVKEEGAVLQAKRLQATMTSSWGKKVLILNSSWRSATVKVIKIMSADTKIKISKAEVLLIRGKVTGKCLVLIGSEIGNNRFRRSLTLIVEDVDKWKPDEEWVLT
ncbi:hypothetical protein F5Y16DRAFT_420285 [Xylariaceae sp. FL0255]|nr:hypothetical protein F5Y16DRAFT_420285 [Xylariaceae sp. FL0255]